MNSAEIEQFLTDMLTESELSVLSKRWRILNMLLIKEIIGDIIYKIIINGGHL